MSSAQKPPPQLHMIIHSLQHVPPLVAPDGYRIRHFEGGADSGDAEHWSRVYAASFERDFDAKAFSTIMGGDPAFLPERIWFATHEGTPVATASAYNRPAVRENYGMIHFVGVDPRHRGHGLGRAVTVAALERMVKEHRQGAWLSTDDHRIPAVKTYLRLGFEPLLVDVGQRDRWHAVFEIIGPDLVERFADQLNAEIHRPTSPQASRAER